MERKRYRHQFNIMEQTGTAVLGHDADGAWSVKADTTFYGEAWTVSGTDRIESQKAGASITHRIRTHFNPALYEGVVIGYNGTFLTIVFVNNREFRNKEIVIDAKETV